MSYIDRVLRDVDPEEGKIKEFLFSEKFYFVRGIGRNGSMKYEVDSGSLSVSISVYQEAIFVDIHTFDGDIVSSDKHTFIEDDYDDFIEKYYKIVDLTKDSIDKNKKSLL